LSGQRCADEPRSSRFGAPHARGFDVVAVDEHHVLLARRLVSADATPETGPS